jgi:hypothetical protein
MCMYMFKVLFLTKLSLIPGDACHDFPNRKTFLTVITTNVATLNIMKAFLNMIPLFCEYILVIFVS